MNTEINSSDIERILFCIRMAYHITKTPEENHFVDAIQIVSALKRVLDLSADEWEKLK